MVVIASLVTGVITAPLSDDVPEALGRWKCALAAIGGRPVEIAVLALSALLFFLGGVGPWLLRRWESRASASDEPRSNVGLLDRLCAEQRVGQRLPVRPQRLNQSRSL